MADFDWSKLVGPAIEAAGGLVGSAQQEADSDVKMRMLRELLAKYQGIPDPRFSDVAPELLGPSSLQGIQSDPALQAQQLEVDAGLKGVVDQGGLTLEDRAAQSQVYDKLARQTAGQNASIRNNLAAHGALNSGAGIAMQMANAQAGGQQAADAARDTTARAEGNRLRAMQQRFSNASQMDDTQYARKAAAARAADAIAAHNASARRQAGIYGNDLLQRQFNNKVTKVSGQRGPVSDIASGLDSRGQRSLQRGAAIGGLGNDAWTKASGSQNELESAEDIQRRRRAADRAWNEGE